MSNARNPPTPAKWTLTLGGNYSTIIYGVAEYIRRHPVVRAVTAILGVLCIIIGIASFSASGYFKYSTGFTLFPFFGAFLIYLSVISGPEFTLTFRQQEAQAERKAAESAYKEDRSAGNLLVLDLSKLNEYYSINQAQAKSSFFWSVVAMLFGFSTILTGVWLFYFRGSQNSTAFIASLSTLAGILVNLVSAMFLHLHGKIQEKSLHYFDQLAKLQELSIALHLVEAQPDGSGKEASRNIMLRQLSFGRQPITHQGKSIAPQSNNQGATEA